MNPGETSGVTRKSSPAIDWPVDLLETIVRDRWQQLGIRYPVIYLYGAGQHTQWLLTVVAGMNTPRIKAILDDSAVAGMILRGVPVISPLSTTPNAVDAVVLSTDNPTIPLTQRCKLWTAPNKPLSLYDGMPLGPYRKERIAATIQPQENRPICGTLPLEIHQLRFRLPAGFQHLCRLFLPIIHPSLSKTLRTLYRDTDDIADTFTRESTLRGLQYVRDIFYPPSSRFLRVADVTGTGLRCKLNLCEVESGNLFFGRDFEQVELNAVRAILNPGDCVIDGGAHIGVFSLIASRRVGERGCVHAFEANPDVYDILLANLDMNHARNVRPNLRALAEEIGQVTLCINEDTSLSSLTDTGRGKIVKKIPIQATSLDDYAQSISLPPVNLLKLDLEGFEWDVLRGATRMIAQNPDMCILCELAPRNLVPRSIRTSDVLAWVRCHGLGIWEIDTANRRLVRLEDNEPRLGYRNYFFARQESSAGTQLQSMTERIPEGEKP